LGLRHKIFLHRTRLPFLLSFDSGFQSINQSHAKQKRQIFSSILFITKPLEILKAQISKIESEDKNKELSNGQIVNKKSPKMTPHT